MTEQHPSIWENRARAQIFECSKNNEQEAFNLFYMESFRTDLVLMLNRAQIDSARQPSTQTVDGKICSLVAPSLLLPQD